MAELKLHDLELSGNCYKVRLLCALLGLHLDIVPVDFLSGAHKKSSIDREESDSAKFRFSRMAA